MTASVPPQGWQIAECLLPGLTQVTAAELTARITTEITGQPRAGVSILGSLLMPGDEVLLCLFAGPEAEVRAVSERAGLPFERILPCVGLGWLARAGTGCSCASCGASPARPARRWRVPRGGRIDEGFP